MSTTSRSTRDAEHLVLVDRDDRPIGSLPKLDCHLNGGVLHRAFSVMILNRAGEVLIQRRSARKLLWPMYWSNACCSHPRVEESVEEAAQRRLREELGATAPLTRLYQFVYREAYLDVGVEHECCHVLLGRLESEQVRADPAEVAEWRFLAQADLERELETSPDAYTPWMRMEWRRLTREFASQLR